MQRFRTPQPQKINVRYNRVKHQSQKQRSVVDGESSEDDESSEESLPDTS